MRKNLSLKILVILIALLLWLQQRFLKEHTVELLIPVTYQNKPDDLVIMSESMQFVKAIITARGMDIFFFHLSKPTFLINASNFKYGKNEVHLIPENLIYSDHIKITILQLDFYEVNWVSLDRFVTKKKPLKIDYASSKDEEYFLQNKIENERIKVEVKGPLSILSDMDFIKTEKISRKMVKNNSISAKLVSPDATIELPQKVITLNILQSEIINKTISLIPVEFPLNSKITIIPQKVSVMIRGPEEILEKLTNQSIRATIKQEDIQRSEFVDVYFEIPSGVKLIDHTPQQIQIIRND